MSLARSFGLEIGALHAPLVPRADGRVLYVDYAPAEILRTNLRHPGVDPADIVEVDIVWGTAPLREAVDEPVDYVLARHVIEHVPDLIGWLLELHAVLKPGGLLGLEIPDRRYTFDIRRHVSTPGEMVEAYVCRHRQPSLRQVFDAASLSKETTEEESWRAGESSAGLPAEILTRLPKALAFIKEIVAAPRYVDVHCWVFTPASFLDTAEALAGIACFPYRIDGFYPTDPGAIEFHVRLSRVEDAADEAIAESLAAARKILAAHEPDSVPGAARQRSCRLEIEIQTLERAVTELTGSAAEASSTVHELSARNARLAAKSAFLEARLDAMEKSTSWRITAPLRSAVRRLRT